MPAVPGVVKGLWVPLHTMLRTLFPKGRGAKALIPAPSKGSATVQYPHGRYELRGDGVNTAYQWVWIPNAPPPPPPPAAAPLR